VSSWGNGELDSSQGEVVVLKTHLSRDWSSVSVYCLFLRGSPCQWLCFSWTTIGPLSSLDRQARRDLIGVSHMKHASVTSNQIGLQDEVGA
jgi:hypothetical protein